MYCTNIYYAPNGRAARIFFKVLVLGRCKNFWHLLAPAFIVETLIFNFLESPCIISLHVMYNVKILFVN